jgi:hypothetical protein
MATHTGQSAFEAPLDDTVFGRLIEEHRLVSAMFDIVLTTPPEEADDRIRAFRTLARELRVHTRAEQDIVYHELDGSHEEGHAIKLARHQHGDIEALIRAVDGIGDGGEAWLAAVGRLKRAVDDHVAMEERQIIPRAKFVLSRLHQVDLLNLYERERAVVIAQLDS